ncbi:MAG: SH3 domain-containing protein [Archangium sp.]
MIASVRSAVMVMALTMVGCAGTAGQTAADGELLEGAEEYGTLSSELSTGVPLGSTLKTTANLNLRTSASMNGTIRLVIPSGATVTTVNVTQPNGGWYNIKYNGVTGWSYGTYLNLVSSPNPNPNPNPTPSGVRDQAIARAAGAVGFSYWWGHGRWIPNGATSSTKGTCTGNCPSCSHGGSYGADCSGLAAKVWEVPSSNNVMTTDSHPYGTVHFVASNSLWSTISRSNVQKGDALTYNENGAGHIFIYESGDGWGSMWAYEAKGCAYGVVHNIRTATSAYKAIKRAGW